MIFYLNAAWWEAALMFGLLEAFCCQASIVFAWYHRVQFRKKYNLMGNLLSEFAITLCCMRLVLCQNYRQLNKLGLDVALGNSFTFHHLFISCYLVFVLFYYLSILLVKLYILNMLLLMLIIVIWMVWFTYSSSYTKNIIQEFFK